MDSQMSTQERQLCELFADLPTRHKFRYTPQANNSFIQSLFWSLASGRRDYLMLFFPNGTPPATEPWKLSDAQGAVEGAEYTEGARGKACGHIFKPGDAVYICRTCGTDDTCVLCSRCFDATDHTGHMIRFNISPGNSGCCDCGDAEAWKTPLVCTIHSELPDSRSGKAKLKERGLPDDLVNSIRMTVARAIDYMCDVISCSPEQLRQPKTVESVEQDKKTSRLGPPYINDGDTDSAGDFALILWNDEKHTIEDVKNQVARACHVSEREGLERAEETDTIGRSILKYDPDLEALLEMATILEQIKVTITVRSSRDTFREQMCGAIAQWLSDVAGCKVGNDFHLLRTVVCEELLQPWRQGSLGTHAHVGKDGIDDEANESADEGEIGYIGDETIVVRQIRAVQRRLNQQGPLNIEDSDDDMSENDDSIGGGTPTSGEMDDEDDEIDQVMWDDNGEGSGDVRMSDWNSTNDQALEEDEATLAGYPPPPPPPPPGVRRNARDRDVTPSDSDTAEPFIAPTHITKGPDVPKTPGVPQVKNPQPVSYWLGLPTGYLARDDPGPEDRFPGVRLDWMILFDLRMWKRVRNELRTLYISTVVTIPEFKRILGIRFAGLYTTLAQLYLIADREPDHSIINISLQMLTTPSITAEIVERGNFLTNLMAILYTFLTTRQVGHPWEVSPNATLAFDSGSVTNRRMYHFLQDLRYLFGSLHVQERLRTEERYLMQFLDLVKLNQGICPNVRAVNEHVEYETDTWISASMITREVNKLCRQISEAFRDIGPQDSYAVQRAIRLATKSVIINSIGAERHRFQQAEIKDEIKFKVLEDFEFEPSQAQYEVPKFVVEEQPISFHHALHYTWSWLIECGKFLDANTVRGLLSFTTQDLKAKPRSMGKKAWPKRHIGPEDYLMAAFDYPLRVCAWLAQMKAGMWVRNGLSLRHQSATYRNIMQRDVSHQRDIFLLQTALVVCDPSRVLASLVDRYGMEKWVKGLFEQRATAQDETQHLDVVEDMIHLMIVLLSDRTSLLCPDDEPHPLQVVIRRDISHVLCFKPLSFSEICSKLPDRYQESEDFPTILNEMATYKHPEGVSDIGTFELRPEFIEHVDPYNAHYNRNQREESEAAYKKLMAKMTGKTPEDVVYEPKLRQITAGLFTGLSDFTSTGMFAQIMFYCLLYPLHSERLTPSVPVTRLETFLQVVLHLVVIAISEDKAGENGMAGDVPNSFVYSALTKACRSNFMTDCPEHKTIVSILELLSKNDSLKACHPKIALILRRMKQKQPHAFESAFYHLGVPVDRISTASPATHNADEERERKKKAARDRQARVMAQFQEQQKNFMAQQGGIDWGDLEDDGEDEQVQQEHTKSWKYPDGRCILCQEDTDDKKLYGTFSLFISSNILRQTDMQDGDFLREVCNTPCNLDRSADDIRPFGVARENRKIIEKINTHGEIIPTERQVIGKGFTGRLSRKGPVSVGCGHIMHYSCFENYFDSTEKRHSQQIARHHPENLKSLEFVCPLCKALGNSFIPIIWKGKQESYPGTLDDFSPGSIPFEDVISRESAHHSPSTTSTPAPNVDSQTISGLRQYAESSVVPTIAHRMSEFESEGWEPAAAQPASSSAPASTSSTSTANTPGFSDSSGVDTPAASQLDAAESPPSDAMTSELVAAYRRLRDTFKLNNLSAHTDVVNGRDHVSELGCHDTLASSLGYTISSVEIQQRGVEAQYGMSLLEKIPEQVLTQLRILAETAATYISIGALRDNGENMVGKELSQEAEKQHCQLFFYPYFGTETRWSLSPAADYTPLLETDTFVFLCKAMFGVGQTRHISLQHLVKLCYLAELVKVVYHMGLNIPEDVFREQLRNSGASDPALLKFATFAESVLAMRNPIKGVGLGFDQPGLNSLQGYYNFVRKYALAFLRKVAILLHVHAGVDLNSHFSANPDADELERLTEALRISAFDEMCSALAPNGQNYGWPSCITDVVKGWIQHHEFNPAPRESDDKKNLPWSAQLSHPAIFELVGLPKEYGTLIDESTRRKCPTTGKEITDASICLFCGEIFCTQSVCCMKEEPAEEVRPGKVAAKIGGAQRHMRRCQGNIGMVLNIKKCCIFYLHLTSGSWSNAPYIDKYGEVDFSLRHGRLLSLSQRRYDVMLRNLWLSHGIPTFISRKMESDLNTGGWESV
ncbi:putative e3 ubiquitin-protein ligase ubr1 protein [Zalerion maritima]|uniref:E3 ubiquitin-protein ligase n=1 Tax=Zalerion maritima TaxID=339359 RepID=A0AAD5WSU5_9PEZI|nr:putative e3 ubiquitin-protein ligase ubr1 protein [Zalerion maritima]